METNNQTETNQRRSFLKQVAAGAAVLGAGSFFSSPFQASAESLNVGDVTEADAWFNKVKGKHKIVFDVIEPKGIFPFAWPKIFLVTNGMTGTSDKDCGVVVILRHNAIPFAMGNDLWAKYKFGEMFKIYETDGKTPVTSNPFWQSKPVTVPGVGDVKIAMNDLQEEGVMFCACNMALTVYSAVAAMNLKQDAGAIYKEWVAGLLPSVQPVPSGVWAVGRAQEHGCSYCFVG
jgi:intracellular sulfur oxidation DsrE/DsrF family protein